MPKVTEAIENYLAAQKAKVNNPEMLALYNSGMEVQINVRPGQPVEDKPRVWQWDGYEYSNIRVPKDAGTDPWYKDYNLKWPLDLFTESIGMTGWDWKQRLSIFWGFDWDAITGHAKGIGISPQQLDEVREAARALPYVESRRSTRGKGIHLYVYGDGIKCKNHTEHAALAHCVLAKMSTDAGFDFLSTIDACGGNMWVWSKDASKEIGSYELLQTRSRKLRLTDLPKNWRDYSEVVTRKRSKVRVQGLTDSAQLSLDELTTARQRVPLEDSHKAVIERLGKSGCSTIWIHDHWLLQTHTKGLEKLAKKSDILGPFKTNSEGKDLGTPNCFMFPLAGGAWKVFRFSPGIQEADTWQQDGKDWTTCFFNRLPDFRTAAIVAGGTEMPDNKGFSFTSTKLARKVIEQLGGKVEIPERFIGRSTILKRNKDGRMVVDIKRDREDPAEPGWTQGGSGGSRWQKVIALRTESHGEERNPMDHLIRATVTPENEFAGFYARSAAGTWDYHPSSNIQNRIISDGYSPTDAKAIMGLAQKHRWTLVCIPYADEFPGGRRWNKGTAKLIIKPAAEEGPHPHWDLIHQNLGQSLDAVLPHLPWASNAGIITGAHYLRAWLAVMIKDPFARSPFLFFWGPEDSGKSIFWESCALFTTGIVKADRAFTNSSDFNGELQNAVFCVVEEKNLAAYPGAKNKVKDLITGLTLSIRKMRTDAYQIPNVTRTAQFSNYEHECVMDPGDTRTTVLFVPKLDHSVMIDKTTLLEKLRAEAPCFLRTLLDMRLPPQVETKSRLRPPVVNTKEKQAVLESNMPIAQFVRQDCVLEAGAKVAKPHFYRTYREWCLTNGHEPLEYNEVFGCLKTLSDHKVTPDGKADDPIDNRRKDAYVGIRLKAS